MMKKVTGLVVAIALAAPLSAANADKLKVNITPKMGTVNVMHEGKTVAIMRNQNTKNKIHPSFSKTSRPCPPFCIQPAVLAPGVETIAEVEMLDYVKRMSDGDSSIMVIDSRTPDWAKKGTIPGAVNIPWTILNISKSDPITIAETMEDRFGATQNEGLWNYSNAKTLVMFCNGMWCGQSPNNIKSLLKIGYPSHKIKWYRGGMQDWEVLGLTTVPGGK